jgi:G3E family GTPase
MVVTAEIRHVCAMGRRDADYTTGPLITLVNGPDFDFLWAERSLLISGQVRGADLVAIGRADNVDADRQRTIRGVLQGVDADPFPLSSVTGEGIERVMASIE